MANTVGKHGPRNVRGRMSLAWVALALLLLPTFVPPVAADHEVDKSPLKAGVKYDWWDPDADGPGAWHFRVPVMVRPRLPDEITPAPFASIEGARNFPVRIELDFTDIVRSIGEDGTHPAWPRDALGTLSSFTFDTESVRVVAYNYDSGKINRDLGQAGLLTSRMLPGLLENREQRNGVFNATSNAVGTVFFVVPGAWSAQLLVFVYFDVHENGARPAATFAAEEVGILDGLHWTRSGTTIFGQVPKRVGINPRSPSIAILAMHDNTTVRVQEYASAGLAPSDIPRCDDALESIRCVDGGIINDKLNSPYPNIGTRGETDRQGLAVFAPEGDEFFFRVDATRPVVVYLMTFSAGGSDIPSTWFPALDGGLVGTEFRLGGLGNEYDCGPQCAPPQGDGPNTLRFVAFQRAATVTVTSGRFSQTYNVPASSSVPMTDAQFTYAVGSIYRVVSTAPIAVAATGIASAVGLPGITAHGSPFGTRLVAPVSRLTTAVAWADTQAYLYNYDANSERLPTEGTQPIKATGDASAWSFQQLTHQLHGEIWTLQSTAGDVSVMAGAQGLWAYGGRGLGTEFRATFWRDASTLGPTGLIVPLYDDTVVTVEDIDAGTGKPFFTKTVGVDDFTTRRTQGGALLMTAREDGATTYLIKASKPIAVYGNQDPAGSVYGTVFAARMAMPDHEIGPAAFFGCVVGWHPKDKGQSTTAKPDSTITFTFRILNLGTDVGGVSRRDDINIAPTRGESVGDTSAWKLTASTPLVRQLPSGEESRVTLTVVIPPTARSGDALEVGVAAVAACNPLMHDEASARVSVQTKYDFDMVFENGKKTVSRALSQEEREILLPIRVRNLGTGNDSINFTVAKAAGDLFGFGVQLLEPASAAFPNGRDLVGEDGRRLIPLRLGVGETRTILLKIVAPTRDDQLPNIDFTVEGVSGSDAGATDQVTASILLNAETKLSIEAEATVLPVSPGSDAVFNLTVVNLGTATDVELSRIAPLRGFPGWSVTLECETCSALEGAEEPILVGSVGSAGSGADRLPFQLRVKAAPGAIVDTLLTVRVTARGAQGDAESIVLTARVTNSFELDIFDTPPRPVLPGEDVELRFLVKSLMNGPVLAEIVPTSLPPGWSLGARAPDGRFPLAPDESFIAAPHILVRANEKPGRYNVSLGLLLEDVATKERVVREVSATFLVLRDIRLNLTIPTDAQAPPGGTVRIPVLVRNVGNQEADAALSLAAPNGWSATLVDAISPVVELAPGESRYVNFSVKAPAAGGSTASFTARAVVPPTGVPIEAQTVQAFPVGVLRRDLKVESVTALTQDFREGQTVLFEVAVRNNGTLPAADVEVALVVDGLVARNFTIQSLPPGETRAFPLVWTATPSTAVTVTVDPRERIADDDRANNAFTFEIPAQADGLVALLKQRVPGPGLAALALAALGAVVLGRRRR